MHLPTKENRRAQCPRSPAAASWLGVPELLEATTALLALLERHHEWQMWDIKPHTRDLQPRVSTVGGRWKERELTMTAAAQLRRVFGSK